MPPNIPEIIAREFAIPLLQVSAAIALLDDGNTIPFIARYRKEMTSGLDEVQLRQIERRLDYLRKLVERRRVIVDEIASQGKLTDALAAALDSAVTLQALEDLYRPYKPRRQTRAGIAAERGLLPLAQLLLAQNGMLDPRAAAEEFINQVVPDVEAALSGARDIVAEQVSVDATSRQMVREQFAADGFIASRRTGEDADKEGRYSTYYDTRIALRSIQPHQWLALRRGAEDGSLKVDFQTPDAAIARRLAMKWITSPGTRSAEQISLAVEDGYSRLLRPSVEREIVGQLTDYAGDHAIQVFAANLRNLLLQPPLRERIVMGIDPGFRTGCKVATVDATGKLLHTITIFPHPPHNEGEKARLALARLIETDRVDIVAIGNGTASRETEALIADLIRSAGRLAPQDRVGVSKQLLRLVYAIVSEAGASVYSASDIARAEFPDLDVSMRGAVSIARRLQDPLAELVKIEAKSIGVGLYQHDVDQKKLAAALDRVVESAVNHVGVDVNTASAPLLAYISGISKKVAESIVACRNESGAFASRDDLRKVKGLGPKAFEQAAGFLRVPGSRNPLDNTTIHPESYVATRAMLELAGLGLRMKDLQNRVRLFADVNDLDEVASMLGVGSPTLRDIVEALTRPGRDPRDDLPPIILRQDVLALEDLSEGMVLRGTVRNVVDFGAFVDIGIKQDGLIHVSKMGKQFVRNPHEVLGVGDIVDVSVVSIDRERGRVGLSLLRGSGG